MEQDPGREISRHLITYQRFIETTEFHPNVIRCLFINAFNHFLSGAILSEKGLITQSNNCLRMGLESEWLGVLFLNKPALGVSWTSGLAEGAEKTLLKKIENPSELIKKIQDTPRIKSTDRRDLYKALSDKSHTKLSSVTRFNIPPNIAPGNGIIDCIPLGGMRGEATITRNLKSVVTVLTFALAEIEDCLGQRFLDKEWSWNRVDLVGISQGGAGNGDGSFEPHVTSQGHPGADPLQAMALLSAIRHQKI